MSSKGWIGVDLDGTLAHYDGWQGADHIGAPIGGMVARVKRWIEEGRAVRIFTARVSGDPINAGIARHHINLWSKEVFGQELPVTNVKDYDMIELWDDRAVAVEENTGRQLSLSRRGLD